MGSYSLPDGAVSQAFGRRNTLGVQLNACIEFIAFVNGALTLDSL